MDLSKIKNIAEKKGISIKTIANKIDMSEQNLHRCIRIGKIAALDLENIAQILDVPIGTFFESAQSYPMQNDSILLNDPRINYPSQESLVESVSLLTKILSEKEEIIKGLEKENKELRIKLRTSKIRN